MSLDKSAIIGVCVLLLFGCSPPRGVYHTVQKGQTAYQIARTYNISPERLLSVNRISDPTRLAIGDQLFIPGATSVRTVPVTVVVEKAPPLAPKVVERKPPVKPVPAPTPPVKKPPQPVVKREIPPVRTSSTRVRKGFFRWPVEGEVVKRFTGESGSKGGNGIEIATRKGTGVLSSAAGKVIYSGNGIAGFGNLVIIEHDGAYYTVYGFNQKNLVEAGSFVSQGQKIALSGIPPSGGVPRLYFEIRSGKEPQDPIFYLP